MPLLKLVWVPSLAADSCARKNNLFESAVAEGNHVAVFAVFGGQLVQISQGSPGLAEARLWLQVIADAQLGKGVPPPPKMGRRKSPACCAA